MVHLSCGFPHSLRQTCHVQSLTCLGLPKLVVQNPSQSSGSSILVFRVLALLTKLGIRKTSLCSGPPKRVLRNPSLCSGVPKLVMRNHFLSPMLLIRYPSLCPGLPKLVMRSPHSAREHKACHADTAAALLSMWLFTALVSENNSYADLLQVDTSRRSLIG